MAPSWPWHPPIDLELKFNLLRISIKAMTTLVFEESYPRPERRWRVIPAV